MQYKYLIIQRTMKTKEDTIRKLKGYKGTEERLYYVELSAKDQIYIPQIIKEGSKVYFNTQEEAIDYFKHLSTNNPITLSRLYIDSYNYKHIQSSLKNEELSFYYTEKCNLVLGSEVVMVYKNREEAIEEKTKKEGELRKRNDEAPEKQEETDNPF